jgi:hypothetical protein
VTKGKRKAQRFALYLNSIGIQLVPFASSYRQWAAVLQTQYNALDSERRKLARMAGRLLIKQAGSIANALAALPNPIALQPPTNNAAPVAWRAQSKEEQFISIRRRWSALTPPCPFCRMRNGFPKRSWPSKEWADEVRERQHDRDSLRVYACPAQPDFWHLGHIRRQLPLLSPREEISISPSQLPASPCETGGHP